jgi:plasmid maintenance system killer protein
VAAQDSRVILDLNSERFQSDLWGLDVSELKTLHRAMKRVATLTWSQVQVDHGIHWERVIGREGFYSIRLNQQARALVTRKGNYLRFESVHFDHDSAYGKK